MRLFRFVCLAMVMEEQAASLAAGVSQHTRRSAALRLRAIRRLRLFLDLRVRILLLGTRRQFVWHCCVSAGHCRFDSIPSRLPGGCIRRSGDFDLLQDGA